MKAYPDSMENLLNAFRQIPSIGKKTAERYTMFMATDADYDVNVLIKALTNMRDKLQKCMICNAITEEPICPICLRKDRDNGQLCVVESPKNLMAIEKTGSFKGKYHVLNGSINTKNNLEEEVDRIGLKKLIDNIDSREKDPELKINELILVISPDLDGEITKQFIKEVFASRDIKITEIAQGVPTGGNLEYFDDIVITKALENRIIID